MDVVFVKVSAISSISGDRNGKYTSYDVSFHKDRIGKVHVAIAKDNSLYPESLVVIDIDTCMNRIHKIDSIVYRINDKNKDEFAGTIAEVSILYPEPTLDMDYIYRMSPKR